MEAILARQIKAFRKTFHAEHGRDPSKKDMDRHPEIAATYKTWLDMRSLSADELSTSSSSEKPLSSSSRHAGKSDGKEARQHATQQQSNGRESKRSATEQQKQSASSSGREKISMPAPTTPRRGKMVTAMAPPAAASPSASRAPRTPQRSNNGASSRDEDARSIHDSAGSARSVMDVPITPSSVQRRQNRRNRLDSQDDGDDDNEDEFDGQASPSTSVRQARQSERTFDDARSPSKLRSLIASFGIPGKGKAGAGGSAVQWRTPTKAAKIAAGTDDDKLQRSLRQSVQNATLFTPRTKARKRLRGELVVTPVKAGADGDGGGAASTTTEKRATAASAKEGAAAKATARPAKRQRGMGTLMNFGVTVGGSQAKANGVVRAPGNGSKPLPFAAMGVTSAGVAVNGEAEAEEEDEDDDMLGPSPSVQRVVNMPVQAFRPLFSEAVAMLNASKIVEDDSMEGLQDDDEDDGDGSSSQFASTSAALDRAEGSTETALTTPSTATAGGVAALDSDEEDRLIVRDYERFDRAARQKQIRKQRDARIDEEEDDEEGQDEVLGSLANVVDIRRAAAYKSEEDEDDGGVMMGTLSLNSPQGKRARDHQRRRAAQSLRQLLLYDDRSFAALDAEGEDDVGSAAAANGSAAAMKNGKRNVTVHGNGKTARMMRGTLTKTARRNLAAAEAAEEERASIEANGGKLTPTLSARAEPTTTKKTQILRRGRDDDDEAAEEFDRLNADGEQVDEDIDDEPHDDDWASDVDSVEYGLGDGYMEEMDVL